jgi:hypothetical protein
MCNRFSNHDFGGAPEQQNIIGHVEHYVNKEGTPVALECRPPSAPVLNGSSPIRMGRNRSAAAVWQVSSAPLSAFGCDKNTSERSADPRPGGLRFFLRFAGWRRPRIFGACDLPRGLVEVAKAVTSRNSPFTIQNSPLPFRRSSMIR